MILYHYSSNYEPELTINPELFGEGSYSKNEYKASSLPRSFYYINPEDRESFLRGKNLYRVEVQDLDIYNLKEDPEDFLDLIPLDVDNMLRLIKKKYKGVLYNIGFDVVAVFVPLKVTRVEPLSEVKSLLKILL